MIDATAAPASLGLVLHLVDERAELAVRGDVDVVTAAALDSVVASLLDGGRRRVVLDLAEVAFLGAPGLATISWAAAALRAVGGALTVRSPGPLVEGLLDALGIRSLVEVEAARGGPVVEEPVGDRPGDGGDPAPGPAADLTRMARVAASSDVLEAAMQLVVDVARETVPGADGVSVSVQRRGRLTTIAASDGTVERMDHDQYELREGPCIEAAVSGRRVRSDDTRTEARSPSFTARARGRDIRSILSSPLGATDSPAGALNVYSRRAGAFADREQSLARVFADRASDVLAAAGIEASEAAAAEQVRDALRTRETVALAQGILMARHDISAAAAHATMRDVSRRTGVPLGRHATTIVAHRDDAPVVPPPPEGELDG